MDYLDKILTSPFLQMQLLNKQTQADTISMSQSLRFKNFINYLKRAKLEF